MDDGSIRERLAANLRRARGRLGISLSELSRRSEIGKATLSQLEAGTGNPTIETVFSLSRALEVPISDLLERREPGVNVVRAAEVEVLPGQGVDLRPLRRIQAGGETVFEVYDQLVRGLQESEGHIGVEHTVVQSGRLAVRAGAESAELGPGDYIGFDARLPHGYTALGGPVRSVLLLEYRADHRFTGTPHPAPGSLTRERGASIVRFNER